MRALVLTIALQGLVARGAAAPATGSPNLRESCRASVAGIFLDAHERTRKHEGMVRMLTEKVAALAKEGRRQDATVAALKARQKPGVFDADLEQAILAADDRARQLAAEKAEDEAALRASRESAAKARAEAEDLKRRLASVFTLNKLAHPDVDYETYAVAYRSPCPAFRVLCPLPDKERKALATLLPESQLPEACQRYSQIRA